MWSKTTGKSIVNCKGVLRLLQFIFCHFLQEEKEKNECYHCLSDFISPYKDDYIGMFALSAGFGVDELCKKYAIPLWYLSLTSLSMLH